MASTGRELSKSCSKQTRRSRELNSPMPFFPTKMQKIRPKERENSTFKSTEQKCSLPLPWADLESVYRSVQSMTTSSVSHPS